MLLIYGRFIKIVVKLLSLFKIDALVKVGRLGRHKIRKTNQADSNKVFGHNLNK
jgi:hypothetical protein